MKKICLSFSNLTIDWPHLNGGGVDNWEWYSDSCADFVNDYMHDNGIKNPEDIEIEDFWFADIARDMIDQYPVYKSMFER